MCESVTPCGFYANEACFFCDNYVLHVGFRLYRVMHGFPDLESYWEKNNPMAKVWKITVPCLCLSSVSDPVIEKRMIPYDAFTRHPNSMLVTTEHGGHCGFLDWSWAHWADELSIDYLKVAQGFSPANGPVDGKLHQSYHSQAQ